MNYVKNKDCNLKNASGIKLSLFLLFLFLSLFIIKTTHAHVCGPTTLEIKVGESVT